MSCIVTSSCDAEDCLCLVWFPVLVILKMVCVLTVWLLIHVMNRAPEEKINRKSAGDNKINVNGTDDDQWK